MTSPITYGCTFLCGATFNEAEPWEQHERDQHVQQWQIQCTELRPGEQGKPCGKIFDQPSDAHWEHLAADHGIPKSSPQRWNTSLQFLDSSSALNFWCGFCRKLFDTGAVSGEAEECLKHADLSREMWWQKRTTHMRDHFDAGADLALEDAWLRIEEEGLKMHIAVLC